MWINKILNIIFPEECIECGAEKTLLCRNCLKKIPWPVENNENRNFAATSYNSSLVKKLIKALKYRGIKKLARPFAELIFRRIFSPGTPRFHELSELYESRSRKLILRNWGSIVVIPIPLSKKRLRQRGFNQAELIAQALSDIFKNKSILLDNVLYRTRDTTPQADIKEKEKRLKNMENVFSVKNKKLIKNKIVFLIDDVSTTGATIKEARQVLLNAGAKKVLGIVVAK